MSKQLCRDILILGVIVAISAVLVLRDEQYASQPAAQTATQGEPTRMRMPGSDVAGEGVAEQSNLQSQAEELQACALLADFKSRLSQEDSELAGFLEMGEEKVFASPLFADYFMESQDPLEKHIWKFFLIAVQRCYANTEGGGAIWDINNRTQVLVEVQP